MAISTQITRISNAANIIKKKNASLGLTLDNGTVVTTSDTLDKQAEAIDNIQTMEGSTVTLQNSEQTIECKSKMMTGNIIIPAVNNYYTGSSIPDNSNGNDGDLYLVV